MTRILALDASTEGCSVALNQDGQITMQMEEAPQAHTKLLLPMVDQILKATNLKLTDLDVLACGRGPGSFTGVRIGVSFAHGLAIGSDLKIIGVGDLEALAWRAMQETNTSLAAVAFDARMGEVYLGLYALVDGKVKALVSDAVLAPAKASVALKEILGAKAIAGIKVAYAGTGFETYPELAQVPCVELTKASSRFPDAGAVAQIAATRLDSAVPPEELLPLYVRDTVTWKKVSEQEAMRAHKKH